MKKILSILLICITFILSGCANCSYCVEYKSNGEIIQTFETKVNKELLTNKGYSFDALMLTLNNVYATYWANKQSSMLVNLNNNPSLTAEERTAIFQSVKGLILNLQDGVKLKITYPSANISNLVNSDNNSDQQTENNATKVTESLFIIKQTQTFHNAFVGMEESNLYKELKDVYITNGMFNYADFKIQHIIALPTSRYKSNATHSFKKNNLTYYVWELNSEPNNSGVIENAPLQLSITQIKPLFWYVSAVIITVIFIVISKIVTKKQNVTKKV